MTLGAFSFGLKGCSNLLSVVTEKQTANGHKLVLVNLSFLWVLVDFGQRCPIE